MRSITSHTTCFIALLLFLCWLPVVISSSSCGILSLFPFTKPENDDERDSSSEGWESLIASQLAIDHFNERNTSIVRELARYQECNMQLHSIVADSQGSVDGSVLAALKYLGGDPTTTAPFAILSPTNPQAVEALTTLTSALGIPQLIHSVVPQKLLASTDSKYKTTIGTAWTIEQRNRMLLDFLAMPGYWRQHVVVISEQMTLEESQQWIETAKLYQVELFVFSLQQENPESITKQVKGTGIQTIYFDVQNIGTLIHLSQIFDHHSLLESNYFYALSAEAILNCDNGGSSTNSVLDTNLGIYEVGSSADKLFSGAMVVQRLDTSYADDNDTSEDDDAFTWAWKSQNSPFVERLQEGLTSLGEGTSALPDSFLSTHVPSPHARFIYDAIITAGLGLCEAQQQQQHQDHNRTLFDVSMVTGGEEQQPTDSGTAQEVVTIDEKGGESFAVSSIVPLDQLVTAMTQVEFTGASGHFKFVQGQKVRDPNTIIVGVYNVRPTLKTATQERGEYHSYDATLAFTWKNWTGWDHYKEKTMIFRDGTTEVPEERRNGEHNYLSSWVRILGFTLMGITMFLNIVFIVMLVTMHKDGIIQRSQPFFLHMLCIGSIVTSGAVLTLSFDESYDLSKSQLSGMCMATPWLFFVGQLVTFGSLATKLYRVDKVLQFRRKNTVTIASVIVPFGFMLLVTFTVLTLWTALDPYHWNRYLVSDIPFETDGKCECDHFWAFFGTLMGLLVFSQAVTIFYAFKTSDVPEDFRDTRSVLYAMTTQLQAWVIGVPILAVLGNDNADAAYLGRVLLIWIFSLASVGIVVGPTLWRAINLRRNPELRTSKKDRVSVTGLVTTQSGHGGQRPVAASWDGHSSYNHASQFHNSGISVNMPSGVRTSGSTGKGHDSEDEGSSGFKSWKHPSKDPMALSGHSKDSMAMSGHSRESNGLPASPTVDEVSMFEFSEELNDVNEFGST